MNRRHLHIRFIIPTSFVFILLLAILGCGGKDKTPQIVARLGDNEITLEDIDFILNRFVPGGIGEVGGVELKNLRLDILNQIIEEKLIIGEAKKVGLDVAEEEIETEVSIVKQEYIGENFEAEILDSYGSMQKWYDALEKRLLIRKLIGVITADIKVSRKESLKFYKEHRDEYDLPEQVKAKMLTIGTEEEAKEAEERLKVEDFAKVAAEISISPEGKKGGDLGYIGRGDMPKEFEDVLFSLPVDEISNVIKTPYGYHIFLVEGKRKAQKRNFSMLHKEIADLLKKEKEEMEFQSLVRRLKDGATIEVMEKLL